MEALELPDSRSLREPTQSVSPTSKLRSNLQESISASKLYRDLSPTRVFASNTKSQIYTSLPDLFRKGGLSSLRPAPGPGVGGSHGEDGRHPKMLDRLETLLEEKLKLVDKLGAKDDGFAAKQLRTDAHRQAFDAFINSFTTYRSLLMKIKREYDLALDDALAALYDNYNLHAQLDGAEEKMDAEIEDARSAALENASVMRQELQDQYNQQEQTALEAEARCSEAEAEIQQRRARVIALRKEAEELEKANRAVKYQMLSESGFKTDDLLAKYAEH
eukprot:gene24113-9688_t